MKFGASIFSLLNRRQHFRPTFSLYLSSKTDPQPQTIKIPNKIPNFINPFISITKTLTLNPKNLNALTQLDSLLTHKQFFDLVTSVAFVEGLCQLRKLNRAKDVIFHLKDNLKVPIYFVFSLVFDCLVKDGKLDDVETQWGEISNECGVNLSDYVIYVCKCGDLEEIKRVCERTLMGSRVLERQCYLALIGALCRCNEGSMAKSVISEMFCRGFRVDDVSYVVVFQCFCRNGDLDGADWVLKKMVKGGCRVDMCVYGSFLHGLCKRGKFREANKLFNKLIRKDSFSDSKGAFLKDGRRGIFQLKCEDVIPEMVVYEMYFRSLCSAGKLEDAEILLKKMMKRRAVPQVCVYGSFIKALFRAGREEDAIKFFNIECKKRLVCPRDLARFVIVELCEKGKTEDAIKISDKFATDCVILHNCLMSSLWSLRNTTEAEEYFDRMSRGALTPPNLFTYKLMVSGFCDQGSLTKALELFEEMLANNIPIDSSICETVIRSLCKYRRREEAYKFLDDMTRRGYIASYTKWRRLFQCLIADGEGT